MNLDKQEIHQQKTHTCYFQDHLVSAIRRVGAVRYCLHKQTMLNPPAAFHSTYEFSSANQRRECSVSSTPQSGAPLNNTVSS